jgi:hypothetical protein
VARDARRDFASAGIAVRVDARQIKKLERALKDAGVGYARSQAVLAQSLNRAGQRLGTDVKRAVQRWTGIRRQKEITKRIDPIVAVPGRMRAGVSISGRHFRITKDDFGASWRKSSAGGRHFAWSRAQSARGSFMGFAGRGGKYGGGLLFKRVGKERLGPPHFGQGPIKPLWGPHPAKEVKRHAGEVRVMLRRHAAWFLGEASRRAEVELRKAKAKYGL